jgi:hypothetical protein
MPMLEDVSNVIGDGGDAFSALEMRKGVKLEKYLLKRKIF